MWGLYFHGCIFGLSDREVAIPEATACHQTHSLHISPSHVGNKFSHTYFELCILEPLLNHHIINHHLCAPNRRALQTYNHTNTTSQQCNHINNHTPIHIYTHTYKQYMYIYICIYIYITYNIYTHIQTYTHTTIHTHIPWQFEIRDSTDK